MPRLPDLRSIVVGGVPFVDLGARQQMRVIGTEIEKQKADRDKRGPGALTDAERQQMAAADARLAEAESEYEAAWNRWVDLKKRRWQAWGAAREAHQLGEAEAVARRILRPAPGEAAVDQAEYAKSAADENRQRALVERNRVYQTVDGARWQRRLGAR